MIGERANTLRALALKRDARAAGPARDYLLWLADQIRDGGALNEQDRIVTDTLLSWDCGHERTRVLYERTQQGHGLEGRKQGWARVGERCLNCGEFVPDGRAAGST